MKYLIVGGFLLLLTILVSRVFVALDIIDLNTISSMVNKNEEHTSVEKLRTIGKQTYEVFCSSCHGMNGEGNNEKAHNHTKRISKKSIIYAINNGSNNFKSLYPMGMPAGLVGKKDAELIADYLVNKMEGEKPKAWATCASCHGENGEGISFIAPNIKTYSDELVTTVLKNGKKGAIGTMPYFGDRLSDMQMKALATHIRSIQK